MFFHLNFILRSVIEQSFTESIEIEKEEKYQFSISYMMSLSCFKRIEI